MRLFFYFVLLLITLGCSNTPAAYTVFKPVGEDGWHADEPVWFVVDSLMAQQPGVVQLHVRMNKMMRYPYKNIIVEVERWGEGDSIKHVDTLDVLLNHHEAGVFFADYAFPIDTLDGYSTSKIQYVVRHLLTPTMLRGVTHVGVEICAGR